MSSHDSDSEKAPSDRAESPDQVEMDERQLLLPEHNPSNIDDNAATSNTTTPQKAIKKPKLARSSSAAPLEGASIYPSIQRGE